MDVFETDLPAHLDRFGTTQLVIAGMAANQCCESTGRRAMEHGYDVTFLRDAIGADNMASYEAAMRVNYPLIANAVLDVAEFAGAIGTAERLPRQGDTVMTADRVRLGKVEEVVPPSDATTGHILVSRGIVFAKETYIPLDAITKVTPKHVHIHVPRIVVHKMPWDAPPTERTQRLKAGPATDEVHQRYRSHDASADAASAEGDQADGPPE